MEKKHINSGDILEDVQRMTGAEYVSDLKDVQNRPAVLRVLSRLALAQYPLKQWSRALSYILDGSFEFSDAEGVSACIRELLQKIEQG